MADVTKDSSVKARIVLANVVVPDNVKNITVGNPDQPGIATFHGAEGEETITENYVTAEGVKLDITDTGTFTFNLASGGYDIITATLSNSANRRMFAMPAVTLYQDSVAAGNEIPDGFEVNHSDFAWYQWIDWGESDNNNVVHKTYIRNDSGTGHDIVYKINFRFMLDLAEL